MKKFLLLFLFISPILAAQELMPIDTTSFSQRAALKELYQLEFEGFNDNIKKEYRSKLRRELTDIHEMSQKEFYRMIDEGEFIFDTRYTDYLRDLSSRIKEQLAGDGATDFRLLLSRSNTPNAFCLPGGTIVLNIGLFRYFSNEDQLLSVICHELGHYILRHPENSALKKAELSVSRSLRGEVKTIAKEKKKQNQQAFGILKNILYSQGASRRAAEQQADSIGYTLFRKISSQRTEFVNAMYFLKDFDSLPNIAIEVADYRRLFDLPEQAFKDSWMEMEDYSRYNYDFYESRINEDSIKSHPEMVNRIEKLKKDFEILNSVEQYTTNSDTTTVYHDLKNLARQEVIHNYYNAEEYGRSIYITLARLKNNPESSWLKAWLGKNFSKLYEAKKGYRLNKYVEHLNPEIEDASYRQFLSFIWNLRLEELKAIGEYYSENG